MNVESRILVLLDFQSDFKYIFLFINFVIHLINLLLFRWGDLHFLGFDCLIYCYLLSFISIQIIMELVMLVLIIVVLIMVVLVEVVLIVVVLVMVVLIVVVLVIPSLIIIILPLTIIITITISISISNSNQYFIHPYPYSTTIHHKFNSKNQTII